MQSSPAPLVSAWLSLLAPLLPLILFGGVDLARRATRSPRDRLALTPAIAVALWIAPVQLAARALHSFTHGLALGTALAALPGAIALLRGDLPRLWRRGQRALFRRARGALALAAGAVLLLAPAALRGQFHDELGVGRHQSMVEQLAMGFSPPHFSVFPQFELRYHIGFDVLAASLVAVFRIQAPLAIDVATLGLIALIALGAERVCAAFVGSRRAPLAAALGLAAGGVPWLVAAQPDAWTRRLVGMGRVGETWVGPPLTSYVFQHPFGLGAALGLAALALHLAPGRGRPAGRAAAIFALFVGLAVGHVVFAVLIAAGVGVSTLLRRAPGRAQELGAIAVAALISPLFGGWFARTPDTSDQAASIVPSFGPCDDAIKSAAWFACTLGAIAIFGPLGLARPSRARVPLAVVAGLGLLACATLRYRLSWDMVKFAAVAQLALGLAAGAYLVGPRPGHARPPMLWRALAAVGMVHAGLLFPIGAALGFEPKLVEMRRAFKRAEDADLIDYLRHHAGERDLVYRRAGEAVTYNQWGLNIPFVDYWVREFGYGGPQFDARRVLLEDRPAELSRWTAQGVRWFVIEPGDPLEPQARGWVAAGQAQIERRAGALVLIRAAPAP